MNGAAVAVRPWSHRRWTSWIVVIFCGQLGLIFWLGERSLPTPRPVTGTPTVRLAGNGFSEFLALADPTLFALPHDRGFSGPAWLQAPAAPVHPFAWTEPTNWLPLTLESLGGTFREFMETNRFVSEHLPTELAPQLTQPEAGPPPSLPTQSTLRLTGGLQQRRLLTRIALPSWPPVTNVLRELDVLTNTVIQVLVGADGKPVSATLLSGSGSPEADRYAFKQANSIRFEPLPGGEVQSETKPLARLTWGRLIFQWLTVPPGEGQGTNAQGPIP